MIPKHPFNIAIACGGTGGHLFPGLAVAEQLVRRDCRITLLVSPKEVDQHAVKMAHGMEIVTLPAVGLSRGRAFAFVRGFVQSYRAAKKHFKSSPPDAALAMGGFTSAPPIFAAKKFGAKTFLHESNTIPGRANRWLSRFVNQAFVGFPKAGARLHNRNVICTGTPVRPQFNPRDVSVCRAALRLEPNCPTLLVMGGSQGASGINELVLKTLPLLVKRVPQLQLIHLTGPNDSEKVRQTCAALNLKAIVRPFYSEMEIALGAATVCISRSGASSLAELAAMRVPSVLIPFPAATDNHQFYNARAFEETGASRLLEQKSATPEMLARMVLELIENSVAREKMQSSLANWHKPDAAEKIAGMILQTIGETAGESSKFQVPGSKIQAPGSEDNSSSIQRNALRVGAFEILLLALIWNLELGIWSLHFS
jgi:UDP-N-acetylglucosamine--N-acetylmuramyl-(pentapeptide) pyrophosphoryl-undecaprenol N-acetylglucosamine transferase